MTELRSAGIRASSAVVSVLSCLLVVGGCSSDTGTNKNANLGTAGTGFPVAGSAGSGALAGTSAVAGTGGGGVGSVAGDGAVAGSAGVSAGSGAAGAAGGGAGEAGGTAGTDASGAGGTGEAGAAGSGGEAGTGSTFKRPCISAGKEVVFIGDSYSDYPIAHQSLYVFMDKLAVADGALAAGDVYRNLAAAGTTLAAAPAGIQTQWAGTKAMTPIKVVVMDGGGNDVLISNTQCRPEGSEKQADCMQVVQNSLNAAKMLWTSMQQTGVSDVLYFWYPHIPGGALTGFQKGTSISDYTYPMLVSAAQAASTDTFHVYMVPTVDIFNGHPEYFYSDGLHANDTGESKIADAVWKVMKDNCIGQGASSGCCMP